MKTYKIDWCIIKTDGTRVNSTRPSTIKFCNNELHAKMKLEKHLKSITPNFGSLICKNCVESNAVSDLFRQFGW